MNNRKESLFSTLTYYYPVTITEMQTNSKVLASGLILKIAYKLGEGGQGDSICDFSIAQAYLFI
jgi:hypothetical protein